MMGVVSLETNSCFGKTNPQISTNLLVLAHVGGTGGVGLIYPAMSIHLIWYFYCTSHITIYIFLAGSELERLCKSGGGLCLTRAFTSLLQFNSGVPAFVNYPQ